MTTTQRAEAYGRVIAHLSALGEAKLHAREQAIVREAADCLLFSDDLNRDSDAEGALIRLYELTDRMVEAERMSRETAQRLVRDVEACGPAVAA